MLAINDPLVEETTLQKQLDNFFIIFYTLECFMKIMAFG